MSKFNDPAIQSLLLDLYAMHGTDTAVARLSGVSRVTLWRMQNMSEEGHPDLQECDWGGVIKPWHQHKLDALDMLVEDVQQRMTHDAGQGQWVPVVHGGEYKWEDCEFACSLTEKQFQEQLALDDETRELLSVPRVWPDKKRRVYNAKTGIWERARATQYVPPTLDAQSKVLSSFAPDVFGDKRKIDLNLSGGLGVTVLGTPRAPPPHVVDVIGPTPVPEIEYNDAEPSEPVNPEPPQSEEEPMVEVPFTPDPNSPLTEEQQRILARTKSDNPGARKLAEIAMQKATAPAQPVAAKPIQPPPPSSNRFDDQDDCIPRNPVGMKVI